MALGSYRYVPVFISLSPLTFELSLMQVAGESGGRRKVIGTALATGLGIAAGLQVIVH